ncbi:c-type cytochrome [Rossellomorea yichunensis]|jgi:Cytochrome C oxidase, cbb3-type, subunit III|uniref:c-type cytochrome n=1 Tax=Rossellomorea yichunensis TaxID=3077331 RepID=UPI0028DD4490|nr:c-type cytochrome [Rossellomorea sp. YC4-1]MDT9026542.1 c-type cytochrome [Rossellomorea sp. YC4-1]
MTIMKNITKGLITFFFLGLVMLKALEWSLYLFVAKPAAEEVAYDVASYVEANDRFFSEDTLNEYLADYKKKDMQIRVLFNQHPDDKRFVVKVDVTANWDSIYSPTAYFQTRGVNFGESPIQSIFARFDSQSDNFSNHITPMSEAPIQSETVSAQEEKKTVKPVKAKPIEENTAAPPVKDEDIRELVENYVVLGMEAIRKEDFSSIEPLLDPYGKMYKESQESVKTINRRGLKEEVLTVQVQRITENTPSEFTADTYEEFKITYQDGTEMIKGFTSSYRIIALENNRLVMNETISVKEVFSEEVQAQRERLPIEIIKDTCISCHGSYLEGGAGPGLVGLSQRMSEENIITILENGNDNMPAGLVSPDEARLLADFLINLEEYGHD